MKTRSRNPDERLTPRLIVGRNVISTFDFHQQPPVLLSERALQNNNPQLCKIKSQVESKITSGGRSVGIVR
jgi:hypothetical protein